MCRQDGAVVVTATATATATARARGSNNSRSSTNSHPPCDGDVIVLVDREHSWYEMSWLVVFAAFRTCCWHCCLLLLQFFVVTVS
jgi:hypothetical protein